MERTTARNTKKANRVLECFFEAANRFGLYFKVFLIYSFFALLMPIAIMVDVYFFIRNRDLPFYCLWLKGRRDFFYRKENSEY